MQVSGDGLEIAVAGELATLKIALADRFGNLFAIGAGGPIGVTHGIQFGLALTARRAEESQKMQSRKRGSVVAGKTALKLGGGDSKVKVNSSGEGGEGTEVGGALPKSTRLKALDRIEQSMKFEGVWVSGSADSDRKNGGFYRISYEAQAAGQMELHLWCIPSGDEGQREPLPGSPFTVNVTEGAASPHGSYVKPEEATPSLDAPIAAGEKCTLRPQARFLRACCTPALPAMRERVVIQLHGACCRRPARFTPSCTLHRCATASRTLRGWQRTC